LQRSAREPPCGVVASLLQRFVRAEGVLLGHLALVARVELVRVGGEEDFELLVLIPDLDRRGGLARALHPTQRALEHVRTVRRNRLEVLGRLPLELEAFELGRPRPAVRPLVRARTPQAFGARLLLLLLVLLATTFSAARSG